MANEAAQAEAVRPPGFDEGVLWAAVYLASERDEPTLAGDLLRESRVDIRKCDPADRQQLHAALGQRTAAGKAL